MVQHILTRQDNIANIKHILSSAWYGVAVSSKPIWWHIYYRFWSASANEHMALNWSNLETRCDQLASSLRPWKEWT